MRIQDLLEQGYIKLSRPKRLEVTPFTLTEKKDTVSISAEAKAAQQQQPGGGYFANSVQELSEARQAFKAYMDQATGRVVSSPRTPEEKMKELSEQIKKLQGQLSEVMSSESLSDSVKTDRINSLTAQINEAYARLTEISREIGQNSASAGEVAG